jgi:putative RecB family exonuclease
VPVYSHSRLSSFENCPKQFHFRYVLKIPSEIESIEAFLGKRVHEVLERLYVFVRDGRIPPLEKVLRRFQANWEEQFDGTRVQIARGENDAETYRTIGERCLRNHYRRHYPFDADETLGLEERVTFSLDGPGTYRMQGVIDRIVRARDGAVEIHDFKTGARVPTQRRLDEDRQLALYQLGLRRRFGDDTPMRLVWHFLQSGQTLTSSRTPDQLDALRERTIGLIERIEAEERFEPRTGPLCGWCEYRERCPAFAAERAAAAPAPAFEPEPAAAPGSSSSSAASAPAPAAPEDQLGLFGRSPNAPH